MYNKLSTIALIHSNAIIPPCYKDFLSFLDRYRYTYSPNSKVSLPCRQGGRPQEFQNFAFKILGLGQSSISYFTVILFFLYKKENWLGKYYFYRPLFLVFPPSCLKRKTQGSDIEIRKDWLSLERYLRVCLFFFKPHDTLKMETCFPSKALACIYFKQKFMCAITYITISRGLRGYQFIL